MEAARAPVAGPRPDDRPAGLVHDELLADVVGAAVQEARPGDAREGPPVEVHQRDVAGEVGVHIADAGEHGLKGRPLRPLDEALGLARAGDDDPPGPDVGPGLETTAVGQAALWRVVEA